MSVACLQLKYSLVGECSISSRPNFINYMHVFFIGGPRLKGQDVVVHFLKIIKNPNYNQHIGVEYCKLLKSAISVPVYQCDISVKTWQGILSCIITVNITFPF